MIRKSIFAVGAALALLGQPVAAQETKATDATEVEAFAAMAEMFKAEPLTAEQEARLPMARQVIARMIPPGTFGELAGSMFDGIMNPIMELAGKASAGDVAKQLGITDGSLALDDVAAEEAALILDPAREERNARIGAAMPKLMGEVMTAMEPAMVKAMGEAYAVHFSAQELSDIDTFFTTESGIAFARKSYALSSDPRIIGAVFEAMPEIMAPLQGFEARVAEANADLPPLRSFGDLSADDRARLAELVGLSVEEIEAGMAAAQAQEK